MIMMIFRIQKILFLLWKHSYKENFRTQSKDSLIVILLSSYKYNMLITRQGSISLQAILNYFLLTPHQIWVVIFSP